MSLTLALYVHNLVHMPKLFLLTILIVTIQIFAPERGHGGSAAQCRSFFGNTPVLDEVAAYFSASPAEKSLAIDRFDSSPDIALEKKMVPVKKDINALLLKLSQEELISLTSRTLQSGFFTETLHEEIVRSVLAESNFSTKDRLHQAAEMFESDAPSNVAVRKVQSQKILRKIQDLYFVSPDFPLMTIQDKMDMVKILKTKYPRLFGSSNKKLVTALDNIYGILLTRGGPQVLELMLNHSLADMTRVVAGRTLGKMHQVTSVGVFLSAMAATATVGLSPVFIYPADAAPAMLSFFGTTTGLLTLGAINKYSQLFKNIGAKVTGVPQEVFVGWRRSRQKRLAGDTVIANVEAQKDQTGVIVEGSALDIMKRELVLDISQPTNLSSWGRGVSLGISNAFEKSNDIARRQDHLYQVFEKNLSMIDDLTTENPLRISRINQNKQIKMQLSQMLHEWEQLSSEVMTLGYVLDLYTAKARQEAESDRLPERARPFLTAQIERLENDKNNLNIMAFTAAERAKMLLNFLTVETMDHQIRMIDIINP